LTALHRDLTGAGLVRSRAIAWTLVIVCLLFLAGHLPWLVTAPTDFDEGNFVMGVRRFDVAAHQPHPPGYPVFIALGKLARPVSALWGAETLEYGGPAAIESRALAIWAALSGAFALVPLFVLLRALEGRGDVALAATLVTAVAPQYWFTAARPLSDMPGLAAVLLVDALLIVAWRRAREQTARAACDPTTNAQRLVLVAALVAGLAGGLRSQTLWLVTPLFFLVVASCRGSRTRLVVRSAAVWFVGVAAWAVPMLIATGGVETYLEALRWQARDDLTGVDMLVRDPSSRKVAIALWNTFGLPWATRDFARVMLGFASIGGFILLVRNRTALALLALTFGPYAAFHLLFQETATTRYALPLVPAVVYLAVRALGAIARRLVPPRVFGVHGGLSVAATLLATALATLTLPAFLRYTRDPSPVFAALGAIAQRQATPADAAAIVASHQVFSRAIATANLRAREILPAPLMAEWRQLGDYWRRGGGSPVLFLRDPRRGSLALVDSQSRSTVGRFRWTFPRQRFLGGIRPDLADLVRMASPPGWFCADGWHLTPETLGIARRRAQPDATAYVRRRSEAAVLVLGGELVVAPGEGRVTASLDGRPIRAWTVSPSRPRFFHVIALPPGSLEGEGPFAELVVRYDPGHAAGAEVWFTQIDVQSIGTPFFVLSHGWHEREYDQGIDREWRWTSDRATTFVHAAGRDQTLRIAGESPLKYFDRPPTVTVRAGEHVLIRFAPAGDFTQEIGVAASLLESAGGLLVIETDRTFVPAETGASPDRRRLGLRLFEVSLR
jgi:hypothetical protein